jgi:hypothetical protein
MTYTVRVDDNYDYMDRDSRYTHGVYRTLEEAIQSAKAIVESYLSATYTPGMSADALYQSYKSFGDDPFIVGPGDNVFSAWDYARARCAVLCGTAA